MKIYCLKCNQANEYSEVKPKFCGNCANPFSVSSASLVNLIPPVPKTAPKRPSRQQEEYHDDEEYESSNSSINLDNITPFQIQGELNFRNTEKLGELALDKGGRININRPKTKKVSKKEFEESWSQELTRKGSNNVGGE